MNLLLWMTQVLLAGVFLVSGARKVFLYDTPSEFLPSPKVLPRRAAALVGVCEMLAAVGLILPWLVGVFSWSTPLAAVGLAVLMVIATGFHVARREYATAVLPAVLCVLALSVAYGRS